MKNFFRTSFFTFINLLAGVSLVLADAHTEAPSDPTDPCKDPTDPDVILNCLLGSEAELIEASPQGSQTNTNLPSGDLTADFLPFFINTMLSAAGTLIFVALVYAGYLMVFQNDNEEKVEKGKKILTYAIVGAFVMATAYAVIYGIATLDLD